MGRYRMALDVNVKGGKATMARLRSLADSLLRSNSPAARVLWDHYFGQYAILGDLIQVAPAEAHDAGMVTLQVAPTRPVERLMTEYGI